MSLNLFRVKSDFFRNVATLILGTSIAQLLPILISPILTRAYTPEEFGVFALFTTLGTILGTIATGRYELAIMLPKAEHKSLSVAVLSIGLTAIMTLTFVTVFYGFKGDIAHLLQNDAIMSWLIFVPIFVFLYGFYQNINYWHNRHARFKILALSRVFQSTITSVIQLISGIFHFGVGGLISGLIIGQFSSVFVLVLSRRNKWIIHINKLHLRRILFEGKKYIKFPLIDGPTSLLNVLSAQLPNVLFAILFSPATAGFYFLTQRVLQAPVTLISGAFLDVFKQKAGEEFQRYGHARNIYKKTIKVLLLISVIPSIIAFIILPDLFSLFFGKTWHEAGIFAQILMPAIFMRFIVSPLSFIIYIAQKQKWNLICMIILCVGVGGSLFLSKDATDAIKGISTSYVIYYLLHLFISMKLAGFFRNKTSPSTLEK